MKTNKFSPDEITNILDKIEADESPDDLCRLINISRSSYYQLKSKYKDATSSNIERVNELENDNRRLLKLYTESIKQREILQSIVEGKL